MSIDDDCRSYAQKHNYCVLLGSGVASDAADIHIRVRLVHNDDSSWLPVAAAADDDGGAPGDGRSHCNAPHYAHIPHFRHHHHHARSAVRYSGQATRADGGGAARDGVCSFLALARPLSSRTFCRLSREIVLK